VNKNRQAALELLRAANKPLSAADVHGMMEDEADAATVYRTLHYLEEKGYVESFILHCEAHGTKRYFTSSPSDDGNKASHHHWFHCERCHQFIDLGDCRMDSLVKGYERETGIKVRTHTLYLTGVCKTCGKRS
jgi:Fur family transcriptional regulator, ferric uptake regulator